MIAKKPKPTADAERRAHATQQAVAILHTLIDHLHVDDAGCVHQPRVMVPASINHNPPVRTVRVSADIPRHLFDCITHWDADADSDLDGSADDEREICTDTEGVNYL